MIQKLLLILMTLITLVSFGQDNNLTVKMEFKKESKVKIDSTFVNYYILNDRDTFYFPNNSSVIQCDYLQSIDRDHNKCTININQKLGNGRIEIVQYHSFDKSTATFCGQISNGLFLTGTYMIKSPNGIPLLIGQYNNNWKYGYWTSYYSNGRIQTIYKYIEGADDPVKTWEFNKTGKLLDFTDVETEIINLINKNNR